MDTSVHAASHKAALDMVQQKFLDWTPAEYAQQNYEAQPLGFNKENKTVQASRRVKLLIQLTRQTISYETPQRQEPMS